VEVGKLAKHANSQSDMLDDNKISLEMVKAEVKKYTELLLSHQPAVFKLQMGIFYTKFDKIDLQMFTHVYPRNKKQLKMTLKPDLAWDGKNIADITQPDGEYALHLSS
jgi:hypothetical protein